MYTDWFKLNRMPFRLRPDADFLYLSATLARARDDLRTAATGGSGLVVLVGGDGTGKTTLLHDLATLLAKDRSVARVFLPSLSAQELRDALASQYGLTQTGSESHLEGSALARFFAEAAGRGRPAVVLVDDAHHLQGPVLRSLLKLANGRPSPTIVLAGEPAVLPNIRHASDDRLGAAGMRAVVVPRLDAGATRGYIEHRLSLCGGAAELFDADAITEIYRYTGGNPKRINILCDRSLTLAETRSAARVGPGEILNAVGELKWVEFTAAEAASALPDDLPLSGDAGRSDQPALLELEVTFHGELVTRRMLEPGRLVIGRGDETDLRLQSNTVSRTHCQIVTADGKSIIEDLGSTNGISANGKRIRVYRLSPKDTVVVGDYVLRCRVVDSHD